MDEQHNLSHPEQQNQIITNNQAHVQINNTNPAQPIDPLCSNPDSYQFQLPTLTPQQVFSSVKPSDQKPQIIDDNRSETSQKSNFSLERKRKGSFLQRLSQKQDTEEDKLNEQRKADLRSVFLENVDYKATKEELELIFQDCAKIDRITIMKDRFTNHPKGCAYISFDTEEGVERALHLSGVTLRNRIIKVHRKRTNLPGIFKGKKDDIGMNILGMMQNFTRGGARGRGMGMGMGRGRGGR